MRILHICSARDFGGGERHLVDLCRELQALGHEIFIALRPTNVWESRLDFVPQENFLHVSIRNSFGMFSAKRIGRFINDKQIDIVHAHLGRDYLAASVANRISPRSKLVITRHVLFSMKPFHRLALRNVDAAIAVSSAVKVELTKIFPAEKIHVIHNGLRFFSDVDRKKLGAEFRTLHGIPSDAKLISTVGELKPLKGQREFVLAANEIVKEFPDCRFVVAGVDNTIDKRFRRELRRLVSVFGLENQFLWLDWLDDLTPLHSATDLFISPSHSESFGLALLEAMANGTPVLSTATDGARELIEDEALLVPVGDALGISERAKLLLSDKTRLAEVGRSLSHSATTRFSLERMVTSTERLYSKLVETEHRDGRE